MTALAFKDACHSFAQAAAPYYHITDSRYYEEALELIENLLEEAEESPDDPLNAVIEMLSRAIEAYENQDDELAAFEKLVIDQPNDLAVLRLLMDQHDLGTADLPEIGSKSMVSRVLSGERGLSKKHIQALSERFGIDPGLFFLKEVPKGGSKTSGSFVPMAMKTAESIRSETGPGSTGSGYLSFDRA